MAQLGLQMDQEKLCCSICLDLLQDTVTIPCGHSYCMSCIKSHWDGEDQKETYSCPQCRQTFGLRPVLVKNTMLADLVEELKKTGLKAAPADRCYAGPGDVGCDFCTGRKLKALKSCLQCLVSYCNQHLKPHYESPAFEKHKLVDPSKKLQENVCTQHNEVMKIFCRTDQKCICILCSMDEHKGHDAVLAAAEMAERQNELRASRQKIQQRIRIREKDVKALWREVETIERSADKAVEDSEEIFAAAKQRIRSRQKAEVSHVDELRKKLEEEIVELRRKDVQLEQLFYTDDHIQFLRSYTALSRPGETTDSAGIDVRPPRYTEDVAAAVAEVRGKLRDVLSEEWTKVSLTEDVLLPQPEPEPKTRTECLQYSRQLTLDPNTAHRKFMITNSQAAIFDYNSQTNYTFYGHPDSFLDWSQVLCKESLTGRCYWEVMLQGPDIFVAVAYKNISRRGDESVFGHNNKSWALQCFQGGYEFKHNNIRTSISGPQSSKIGVYLDHRAGVLCFYSVNETSATLLHRVQTTFTQPLCPGFGVHGHSASAVICDPSNTED